MPKPPYDPSRPRPPAAPAGDPYRKSRGVHADTVPPAADGARKHARTHASPPAREGTRPSAAPYARRPPVAGEQTSQFSRDDTFQSVDDSTTDGAIADGARSRRDVELRLYGLNAVRAMFTRRPEALRKLYLAEARIPQLQPMLKWCVSQRIGYRVVDEAGLQKLAGSAHHEGLVADVLRDTPQPLSTWLRELPAGPCCALWLDGVRNPHNLGAILRSAAHFGVAAVLLPKHSDLALSGAAARVAEGGAEAVPFVRMGREDNSMAQLRGAGFALAATMVRGGADVFAATLPPRLVYVLGAEGEGMNADLARACDLRLSIPGSGAVDSLNVAAATAVLLGQWARRAR